MYPGQTGTPHPQAPSCKKARMFKVLREVEEEVKTGSRASSQLQLSGRVRSPEMKQLLARQLGTALQQLEGKGQVDLKTGQIKSKQPKKEKSPLQLAQQELKKLLTVCLDCFDWNLPYRPCAVNFSRLVKSIFHDLIHSPYRPCAVNFSRLVKSIFHDLIHSPKAEEIAARSSRSH